MLVPLDTAAPVIVGTAVVPVLVAVPNVCTLAALQIIALLAPALGAWANCVPRRSVIAAALVEYVPWHW
jgi:hypothetical protein